MTKHLYTTLTLFFLLFSGTDCRKNNNIIPPNNGVDTSSHNFTFTTYTFGGQAGSSLFRDVAIVNDSDIWAVGIIYVADTNVNGYTMYNAAHWDGNGWTLESIMFPLCDENGNQQGSGPYTANGIFPFSSDDIWISCDVSLVHWNGENFEPVCMPLGYSQRNLGKMWGANGQIYLIGTNGFIAKYSTGSWTKLSSGTGLDLGDIYSKDGKEIYAVGGDPHTNDGILLKGDNDTWQTLEEGKNIDDTSQIFHPYFSGVASIVWVDGNNTVYFGASLLYEYVSGKCDFVKTLPGNYLYGNSYGQYRGVINKMRGNAGNDMVIAGDRNTLQHFNGSSWQQLGMPYDVNSNYDWLSVDMKNNTIAAAGFYNGSAVVMILKRR